MHKHLFTSLLACLVFTLLSAGCVKFPEPKATLSFPETSQVQITFQPDDIPADCRVFSHRLVFTPADVTGRDVHASLLTNAQANGADMILVGLVREQPEAELKEYQFFIYGPSSPYLFQSRWNGWKYGFKDWRKQGDIIDFGIDSFQDGITTYRQGIIMQNVYLTCRPLDRQNTQ